MIRPDDRTWQADGLSLLHSPTWMPVLTMNVNVEGSLGVTRRVRRIRQLDAVSSPVPWHPNQRKHRHKTLPTEFDSVLVTPTLVAEADRLLELSGAAVRLSVPGARRSRT